MKKSTLLAAAIFLFASALTLAFAQQSSQVEKGRVLFNDPAFAGGKKSCNSCHPDGKGLEQAGMKTRFSIMGLEQNSLEEAINVCIVNANKGNAIDVNSAEMQEMVSYIKSLGAH